MLRKIMITTVVLALIMVVGGGAWYGIKYIAFKGATPSFKITGVTSETFTPGTYKVYKNDELGFSFKYPKNWFIAAFGSGSPKPSPVMAFQLSNYDTYKIPTIPEEKEFYIICGASQDYFNEMNETHDNKKRIFYVADKVYGVGRGHAEIKGIIDEIYVKGGKVYLVKMTRKDRGSKEYEVGMTYLAKKDYKYLVTIFPERIADRETYIKILESVEIY